MPAKTGARMGLRLTLPGAPQEPHKVHDLNGPLPGWYHPIVLTPVGVDGWPSLEDAKRWALDPHTNLELVPMSEAQRLLAREYWTAKAPSLSPASLRAAARFAEGDESSIATDQVASPEKEA